MKQLCHTYILLTALFVITGCARDADSPFPEPEPAMKHPIFWSVSSAQGGDTRALVDDDLLRESCTPAGDGSNESIGIWGEFTVSENGQETTFQEFDAEPLTYGSKDVDANFYNNWNYAGDARYWESQAVYDFRACYPQGLMTELMTQMNATMFQGGPINTILLQEDILLAAAKVDTRTANLAAPVKLNMQHAFAALKFTVQAVDGFTPAADEGVTSCWLQNKQNATDLFSPSGYLVHSGNSSPVITWYTYESSTTPMYVWKHEGVGFDKLNTLYAPNGGMEGEEYTGNDGWLLIVPQSVKQETLSFCYTLKNAGSQVFSVDIPAITYEPGKKYTYLLEIRGSEVELKLTIKPWNHIESSYDIII